MKEHGQNTDNLQMREKGERFGVPRIPPNLLISCLAEKGGSRTLRGPYDPQTGFEDQRHHRAPSFSRNVFNGLWRAALFCLSIRLSICEVAKAAATSSSFILRLRLLHLHRGRAASTHDGRSLAVFRSDQRHSKFDVVRLSAGALLQPLWV